jgi:hypothetical protein
MAGPNLHESSRPAIPIPIPIRIRIPPPRNHPDFLSKKTRQHTALVARYQSFALAQHALPQHASAQHSTRQHSTRRDCRGQRGAARWLGRVGGITLWSGRRGTGVVPPRFSHSIFRPPRESTGPRDGTSPQRRDATRPYAIRPDPRRHDPTRHDPARHDPTRRNATQRDMTRPYETRPYETRPYATPHRLMMKDKAVLVLSMSHHNSVSRFNLTRNTWASPGVATSSQLAEEVGGQRRDRVQLDLSPLASREWSWSKVMVNGHGDGHGHGQW